MAQILTLHRTPEALARVAEAQAKADVCAAEREEMAAALADLRRLMAVHEAGRVQAEAFARLCEDATADERAGGTVQVLPVAFVEAVPEQRYG
ncbi:hypothetical protein [Azospirillum sp. ST 5-10]|uniref:hypothetical protein n=1 Tax=unclassified Azospirillum TaxID=2630922 RepID=UPI003F4A1AB0